jgi:hypothetical protein
MLLRSQLIQAYWLMLTRGTLAKKIALKLSACIMDGIVSENFYTLPANPKSLINKRYEEFNKRCREFKKQHPEKKVLPAFKSF